MRTAGAWIALAVAVLAYPSGPAQAAGPDVTFLTSMDGVPLCVAEGGNPQGPPVVLIHGFAQSYAVFQRQFDSPLAAHYRLLALDMRGHGCSGKPWDRAAYDQARPWADDIHTLLEAKKLTRPLLVGWSAGGFWIMDYVREYGTAAVAGLVLAGSHGGLLAATPVAAQAGDIKAMRAAAEAYPAGVPEGIELSDRFVSRLSARPLPADLSRIMGAAALMLPAYARRAMAGRDWDNRDLSARLELPVLFIMGDADRAASPGQMSALAERLPEACFSLYPDTGHATFAEQPDRFNREVEAFARRAGAGKTP